MDAREILADDAKREQLRAGEDEVTLARNVNRHQDA